MHGLGFSVAGSETPVGEEAKLFRLMGADG